jgi:hypothetical protein
MTASILARHRILLETVHAATGLHRRFEIHLFPCLSCRITQFGMARPPVAQAALETYASA